MCRLHTCQIKKMKILIAILKMMEKCMLKSSKGGNLIQAFNLNSN